MKPMRGHFGDGSSNEGSGGGCGTKLSGVQCTHAIRVGEWLQT